MENNQVNKQEEKKEKPKEKTINFYGFLEKFKIEGVLRKAYLKKYDKHKKKSKTLKDWKKLTKLT